MFERFKRKPPDEPTWRDRLREAFTTLQFYVYTLLVIALLLLGFVWPRMFIRVPAGHHAVLYQFFEDGTVTDQVWGEGFHVIAPWDTMTVYETRLQERRLEFSVLSDEGLDLAISVAIRYRPHRDQLGYLHQDIGPTYFERLVQPEVEAHVRRTFGNRPAHEIYASAKDVLQELRNIPMISRIDDEDFEDAELGYIDVQEIKLVDIDLPEIVKAAIAEKYRQEQLMLEYRYKLEREEQEAERKRIEAAGIRDYNAIAEHISPDLLRWRDIEATRELAAAPSSKVILLSGGGDQQPPLLFGLGESPQPTPVAAEPGASTGEGKSPNEDD